MILDIRPVIKDRGSGFGVRVSGFGFRGSGFGVRDLSVSSVVVELSQLVIVVIGRVRGRSNLVSL